MDGFGQLGMSGIMTQSDSSADWALNVLRIDDWCGSAASSAVDISDKIAYA